MAAVTIYTDASLCSQTGAGGWGAWLRREDRRELVGARFRGAMGTDCNVAEMAAAANGVAAAISLGMAEKGDLLVLVTDSQAVLKALFDNPEAPQHPRYGRMVTEARRLVEANGLRARANKVKGHSRADGVRSYINGLVDQVARKHMRAARAALAPTGPGSAAGDATAEAPVPAPPGHGARHAPTSPSSPAQIGPPVAGGSLDFASLLWQQGVMGRRAVVEAVAAVAARERCWFPDAWTESCARARVIDYGLPVRDPAEARRQASLVSPEEFAATLLRPRIGPAELRALLVSGEFPQRAEALEAAEALVVGALARAGHDGVEFRSPGVGRLRLAAADMFSHAPALGAPQPEPGPAPGMR